MSWISDYKSLTNSSSENEKQTRIFENFKISEKRSKVRKKNMTRVQRNQLEATRNSHLSLMHNSKPLVGPNKRQPMLTTRHVEGGE
mmetsp:Transcript_30224/g.87735  ORF Transcript_30224/g.87735 Transcript_30224/m.87735 type:complete len:86 (+) Transcript_30224:184-441(+)